MTVFFTNKTENPELSTAIFQTAAQCVDRSVVEMEISTNAHPVTAIMAMMHCLFAALRRMDQEAAIVVLAGIPYEDRDQDALMSACQTLVEAYEAQIDKIEHQERGGHLS